jgi:hypothetical protein
VHDTSPAVLSTDAEEEDDDDDDEALLLLLFLGPPPPPPPPLLRLKWLAEEGGDMVDEGNRLDRFE